MPFGLWTWVGPRNHVLDGGPDPPWEETTLRRERYLHGKWLAETAAERARTTMIFLRRNPSFGETKLCGKLTTYDRPIRILCSTVSVYELFNAPRTSSIPHRGWCRAY